jgi:hypothetical protein
MSDWFQKQLSSDERGRRRQFKTQFASYYRDFRSRRLSEVRHNIEHRTGVTPATFTIKGLFGDTHTGSPTQPVPISETRKIDDPTLAFLAKPNHIQPRWDDFEIEGKPGFSACREHLDAAIALVAQGRKIADLVHGTKQVSIPVPVVNQIRIYWWCSPPRTGRPRMCPVRSTARETGVSFSKDRCVRTSL